MKARPTKRAVALGTGALLLFAVGTNVQAGWVLVVAALLLGILVAGAILPLRALRGIEVERDVPRTASVGQNVPVTIGITNSSRGVRGLVRAGDSFLGKGWAVTGLLLPGETRSYVGERDEVRRGVYTDGPCELETGAPFGVLRVRKSVSVASSIVVYPKVYDVPPRWLSGPGGVPSPAQVGDVASVRDYRPGDPLRHIHWRSVARRGQLMVREFDRERRAETTIVASVTSDQFVADAVASVACSLAIAALEDGDVRLVTANGDQTRVERVRTKWDVLEWGARLESDDASVAFVSMSELTVVVGRDDIERRSDGQTVVLRLDEVESWFQSGCVVS